MEFKYNNKRYRISNGWLFTIILSITIFVYILYNAYIYSTLAPESIRKYNIYEKKEIQLKNTYNPTGFGP